MWTGGSWAFAVALATIVVWGVTGPVFGFSDTWQLVINTGTTIITFLMVFLIQRSQNKDSRAVHLKLNEIVAALQGASNRLINVEDLTETEIRLLHEHYQRLVTMAKRDAEPHGIAFRGGGGPAPPGEAAARKAGGGSRPARARAAPRRRAGDHRPAGGSSAVRTGARLQGPARRFLW